MPRPESHAYFPGVDSFILTKELSKSGPPRLQKTATSNCAHHISDVKDFTGSDDLPHVPQRFGCKSCRNRYDRTNNLVHEDAKLLLTRIWGFILITGKQSLIPLKRKLCDVASKAFNHTHTRNENNRLPMRSFLFRSCSHIGLSRHTHMNQK